MGTFHVDDEAASSNAIPIDSQKPKVAPATSGFEITRAPVKKAATQSPGLWHAAKRGAEEAEASVEEFGGKLTEGTGWTGSNILNYLNKESKRLAEIHRKSLAEDVAAGGASQTPGEKFIEGSIRNVGAAVPYLAATGSRTEQALKSGAIGAIEARDKGPWEMLQSFAESAAGSLVGAGIAGKVGSVINKIPDAMGFSASSKIPKIIQDAITRSTVGGVTGGIIGYAASGGSKKEAASQAGAGAILGAAQPETTTPTRLRTNLPPVEERAKILSAVTGEVPTKEGTGLDLQKAYIQADPYLRETIRVTGKVPQTAEEHAANMLATMGITESEYQDALDLASHHQGPVSGDTIANSIRAKAKPFMDPTNASRAVYKDSGGKLVYYQYTMPGSELNPATGRYEQKFTDLPYRNSAGQATGDAVDPATGRVNRKNETNKLVAKSSSELGDYLEAVARQWEGKNFDLSALDSHRKYLFSLDKPGARGRIDDRTNAEHMADDAAHSALKDLIYSAVDREVSKPGWAKGLKQAQANLYDLLDAMGTRNLDLKNKEAIKSGTPLFQRLHSTFGVHPGGVVSTIHAGNIFQNPKTLKSANVNVRRAYPGTGPITIKNTSAIANARVPVYQMKTPDGRIKDIPADQVDEAKKRGAVMVK